MKPKVEFQHVTKTYSLYKKSSDKLFDLFSLSKKRTKHFYALRDISFTVYEGETIGIVGTNGSGKSTLSNLLSQSVPHTSGEVKINGEPSLIAISAGLDKNLTGMDNIQQKCLMHGLSLQEIKAIKEEIIDFADLGDFIHQPVKNYSSGMKSRLGFSISVHTDPDILIIDEALSVGDQTFYEKCTKKIEEFKTKGKTIFFVSHSIGQIKNISDRVMWIHFGTMKEFGDSRTVLKNYHSFIKWFNSLTEKEKKAYKETMLEEQSASFLDSEFSPKRKSKHKSKKDIGLILQIAGLLLLLIGSGFSLFTASPVSALKQMLADTQPVRSEEGKKEKDEPVKLNKDGIVIGEDTLAYDTPEKNSVAVSIPFSSSIYVTEEYKDVYGILYESKEMYVRKNEIKIFSLGTAETASVTMDQFSVLFPDSFLESYEYFTAQLGSDYTAVSAKLRGFSESTGDTGRKTLYSNDYGVSFTFNPNNSAADQMIVQNILIAEAGPFKELSQVVSANESKFLIAAEDFTYILDTEAGTLTVNAK